MNDINKVLVLSPHTDDGELGAGGTIAKFLEQGIDIYYIAFSGCEASVPTGLPKNTLRKECMRSMKSLGIAINQINIFDYQVRTLPIYRQEILEQLIVLKNKIHPDLVLVPSSHDVHQDHGVIHAEAIRAFKKETSIWGYEHPWNNLSFSTDILVVIRKQHLEKKLAALKEYKSQVSRSYMNKKNILALSQTRGSQIDQDYAEAFELIRLIVT
jgi:LmbE family N-acetylglucosaminyl deacetylase